ncbi:MAG: hypothetical protein H0V43_02935 [Gemmatimonadales bacterium]|nr:hypothetical protein [Gemmatimonadales bacterium]
MYAAQKALEPIEIGLSLSRDKRFSVPRPCIMPARRDLLSVGSNIPDCKDTEPGVTQHGFVCTWWNEEVEADRTPHRVGAGWHPLLEVNPF